MARYDPRIAALHAMFDTSGHGLEIGASYNPVMSKRAGFHVDVMDHATTDELREKYATDPAVDVSRIEEVDYVWDGRPLSDVVGACGRYDYVVASHVIEHVPDLLGFLSECGRMLKPTGTVVLAVPDKRRCFDVFRPLSSTGDVLQAHAERRRVHAPATAFDHVANFAALGGAQGWSGGACGTLALKHDLGFAQAVFRRALTSTEYFDFHAWIFTPSSFRLILRDMHEIGALEMRESAFRPTDGIEFFVTLRRDGTGCPFDRLGLLRAMQQEIKEYPESPPRLGMRARPGMRARLGMRAHGWLRSVVRG